MSKEKSAAKYQAMKIALITTIAMLNPRSAPRVRQAKIIASRVMTGRRRKRIGMKGIR
ncbi:hypothetical protein [Schauerella aestuarii]|uniref:hypothetical protein n=1 Tax=Schauerella aestuarii TaxID=2511204 RepID=UPI00137077FD|nr:hypothetical protein [Achromobacter aestuarii]